MQFLKHKHIESGLVPQNLVTNVRHSAGYAVAELDCTELTKKTLAELIDKLPPDSSLNYFEFMFEHFQKVDDFTGLYAGARREEKGFSFSGGNHGRTRKSARISQDNLIDLIWNSCDREESFLYYLSPID